MTILQITEYAASGLDVNGVPAQIAKEPALAYQEITTSGASAQSAAFNLDTRLIRISADANVRIRFGASTNGTSHGYPCDCRRYGILRRHSRPENRSHHRIMQALAGFSPDSDPTLPGVLTDCTNFIPYETGMMGAPSAVTVSSVPALAAACIGSVVAVKLDATRRTFAGTATKLYELLCVGRGQTIAQRVTTRAALIPGGHSRSLAMQPLQATV